MTAPSFTCPLCGMTSYHPVDIAEGFCGNCDDFTGEQAGPDQHVFARARALAEDDRQQE